MYKMFQTLIYQTNFQNLKNCNLLKPYEQRVDIITTKKLYLSDKIYLRKSFDMSSISDALSDSVYSESIFLI